MPARSLRTASSQIAASLSSSSSASTSKATPPAQSDELWQSMQYFPRTCHCSLLSLTQASSVWCAAFSLAGLSAPTTAELQLITVKRVAGSAYAVLFITSPLASTTISKARALVFLYFKPDSRYCAHQPGPAQLLSAPSTSIRLVNPNVNSQPVSLRIVFDLMTRQGIQSNTFVTMP